jgi:hypothetical protein
MMPMNPVFKSNQILLCRALCAGGVPVGYSDIIPKHRPPLLTPLIPETDGCTIYDFMWHKNSLKWKNWSETIEPVKISPASNFSDIMYIIVPTIDTQR